MTEAIVENSVSALASLVLFPSAPFRGSYLVKSEMFLASFLKHLPLRVDEDEARICHNGLCHLVESGTLAGNNKELLRIIGEILHFVHQEDERLATAETLGRLDHILQSLWQSEHRSKIEADCVQLDAAPQAAISNALFQTRSSANVVITPEKL